MRQAGQVSVGVGLTGVLTGVWLLAPESLVSSFEPGIRDSGISPKSVYKNQHFDCDTESCDTGYRIELPLPVTFHKE